VQPQLGQVRARELGEGLLVAGADTLKRDFCGLSRSY
jgi:hypothetical protein